MHNNWHMCWWKEECSWRLQRCGGLSPYLWGGGHLLCVWAPMVYPKNKAGKEASPLCFLPSLSSHHVDMVNVYQVYIVT